MINRASITVAIILFICLNGFAQSAHLYEIGVRDSVYSSTLDEQRIFWLQYPENYNPESPQKYPVVYVLDGEVHLQAVTTVHSYYWGGFVPEMILVGISNGTNRTRDLTTSEIKLRHGKAFGEENGGADKFMAFIENELIPYIETKYPVTPYRTLVGHSYAGLFTINTLLQHPGLFDNYLAIDPSLDWDNRKLLKQSQEILDGGDFKGESLFMSLGGQLHMQKSDIDIHNVMGDSSEYTLFARSNIEFSKIAENSDLNFQWKYYERDLHGSVSLPSILDGLIYLFDWYPIEHTDMFNSPETPKDELVQLIRKREQKLKEHFGYFVPPFEEELLSMLGFMNMEWGETEKSLAFFQLTVEYFPRSANAYDSLADYYESQNDFVNALKSVTRAYELSGEDSYKNRMKKLKDKI